MKNDNAQNGKHVLFGHADRFIRLLTRRFHPPYVTLGDTLETRMTAGLLTYTCDHRSVDHGTHPTFTMTYILCGRGRFRFESTPWTELAPGILLYRPAHERFSITRYPSEPWCEFFFTLPAAFSPAFASVALPIGVTKPGLHDSVFAQLLRLIGTLSRGDRLRALSAAVETVLLFMRTSSRPVVAKRDAIERGIALLSTGMVDLQEVAQRVGLHYEQFRKAFTTVVGISPREFMMRRRFAAAEDRILRGEPLSAIAESLGYADYYAFTHQFKKITGLTPTQCRNAR